ncbi:MAG: hypothetical protein ACRD50_08990 [Candidatus Acidiferrales bacterium]
MSAQRYLRNLFAPAAARRAALVVFLVTAATLLFAQDIPHLSIDDKVTAFDIASDGRIAYAVIHLMHKREYEMQRDDIWMVSSEGKKTQIVKGDKLVSGNAPLSYSIEAITFSPDGTRLAVLMDTVFVVDSSGTQREAELVDLMDAQGKEINIAGTKNSTIPGALDATWLGDNETVAYLTEAVKPKLLFSLEIVRPAGGRGGAIFEGRQFSAVAWDAKHNAAIAVERDQGLSGPAKLISLDLIRESRKELATLDGYLGELSISPSGSKVAYFRDGDTIEIRELSSPDKVTRVPAAYGHFYWAPDERRLLLKRGPDIKSGDLVWVSIPDGNLTPILHDLPFRRFEISPDGRWLVVSDLARAGLLVYPLPQ